MSLEKNLYGIHNVIINCNYQCNYSRQPYRFNNDTTLVDTFVGSFETHVTRIQNHAFKAFP